MKKKREVNYDKIGFITSKICLLLGLLIDIIAIIGLFKITTFSYHFTYYIYFPSLLVLIILAIFFNLINGYFYERFIESCDDSDDV